VEKCCAAAGHRVQILQTTLEETRVQAAKQCDKGSCRNNIMIYNVPENDEARAEKRNKTDVDFCMLLFNNVLNTGMVEYDLLNVFFGFPFFPSFSTH